MKKIELIAITLILLLGFYLRNHNIGTWPREGATFDEYAWTWQGMSLIDKGIPTSWSPHPQYKKTKEILYHDAHFRLVTPYLEHPPLFGLIAGSYAKLAGVNSLLSINISKIRGLSLILGILSIGLVILLAREIYGTKIGLLSGILYATIPTVVVGSKLVQNENFFIPVWLFSLWLIVRFLSTKKKKYLIASSSLAGILVLAKVPWIAAPFSIFIILMVNKKYKEMFLPILFTVASFIIYFAYGIYYDKDLFFALWGLQLNRYDLGFTSIFALFQRPFLADRYYTDGWIYWGWFAICLALVKDIKKHIVLASAFISYFLIFLAGIPDESGHGWYRYPFYPFLVISIALFIKEYFNKNYFLTFLFLVLVGTTLLEHTFAVKFGFSYPVFRLAIIGWGITLIPEYLKGQKIKTFAGLVNYLWLILFLVMNIYSGMHYNEQ